MMLGVEVLRAMSDELQKIAAAPMASIGSVPKPGAGIGISAPRQPKMVSPSTSKSNLFSSSMKGTAPKTNYSSVGTKPPTPNVSLTSAQQATQPPVVR